MNAFLQDARRGRLQTVLGASGPVLLRLDGLEELSGDFEWHVEALADRGTIDLDALLGTAASVEIDIAGGTRIFDGIVCEASHRGLEENGFRYDLVLRPWLHLAGLRRNHRIFHDRTVVQIVEAVLADYADLGEPHLEVALTGDYPVLEYTVQYGESDANFVRRQLERFGITWRWRHHSAGHTMVLTDAMDSHPLVPGGARAYRAGDNHARDAEQFDSWGAASRITTGAVRLTEYNFKTPKAAQEVERAGDASHPRGDIESFDWPGDYLDAGQGRGVAARRLDAERGQAPRHRATGDVVSLGAGDRVTLAGDPVENATGRTFLCLRAEHVYRSQAYGTGRADRDDTPYRGAWTLIPEDAPLAPARRTPAPRVPGPETAFVVGEGEIDCDEYGRILVRYHWDLEGAHSMRCRVLQTSASNRWGGMVIPRIGMEVVVEHLNGDPDKPLVTGCVFNGRADRPYDLPRHKTKHVMRADSHEGKGFNEISFEAQAGQENMAIHAQRDQTFRVLNDQSSNIGANRIETIGANASVAVAANAMQRVGGNQTISVGGGGMGLLQMLMPLVQAGGKFMRKGAARAGAGGGVPGFAGVVAGVADLPRELAAIQQKGAFGATDGHRDAGGAAQLGAAGTMARLLSSIMPGSGTLSTTVEKFYKLTVGQGATEQVGLAKSVLVGNVLTTSVGKLMQTKVGEDYDLEAKRSIFSRTRKHVLHAKDSFTIAGPGGTIVIDQSGVTIKARHLKIKAPKVDFMSGSPDQVDALRSDKAFVQECKGK